MNNDHDAKLVPLYIYIVTCKAYLLVIRFNVNLLLSIALGISALSMIAIPLCHMFALMLFLAALYGGCFGGTDTFTTVQLIRMYGKKVRSSHLYNNKINARVLIGQSAMVYCAGKPMEKWRVF